MTEIANPTLGKAEDLFKVLVWDPLVKVAIATLVAQAAWMALPVIGAVLQKILTLFSDVLYGGARLTLDLEAITLVNESHRKAFDKAASALVVFQHDFGLDSPQYKKAREDAKAALSAYVRFNGA